MMMMMITDVNYQLLIKYMKLTLEESRSVLRKNYTPDNGNFFN